MAPVHATDETFQAEVLESPLPVLVDFWAEWCAPCRMVAPVLEELSDDLADTLKIVKVDVDACPRTSATFGIRSIPTLVMFKDGKPVGAQAGALPKPTLMQLIEEWLPEAAGPMISVKDLEAKLDEVVIFDLRREQDFARSHILKSRVVPETDVRSELSKLPDGSKIVLICRTGEESLRLARELAKEGHGGVQALENGLLEWEGSQKPTYSTKEEEALKAGTS